MDLPRFFPLEPAQLVRELDGHGRLYEERRTRMGFIVNDSAHVPLPLSANRHHITPVTNADGRIRDPDPLRQIRDEGFKLPHDLVSRAAELLTDSPEIGAGRV